MAPESVFQIDYWQGTQARIRPPWKNVLDIVWKYRI